MMSIVPEEGSLTPSDAQAKSPTPSDHVPLLSRPTHPYGSVLKQNTQTNVVPPPEEDEPQQSEIITPKLENMTQGPKNT